jgi:hypothetical protein
MFFFLLLHTIPESKKLLYGDNANVLAVVSFMEFDMASFLGEQGVVSATTNVLSRMEFCSMLTHENFTSLYKLTTKSFDTKTLGIGITTVS